MNDFIAQLRERSRYIDRTFWMLFGILVVVAIIALFSASSSLVYQRGSILGPVGDQILFLVVGMAAAYFIQFLPTQVIRFGGYGLLIFATLCLYLMLIPHNPFVVTINGAGRWFNLLGFRFQPSELAKPSLIIVIADQLSRIRSEQDKKQIFYRTLWITGGVVLPILTGNLSTAVLICLIVLFLWILARIPFRFWGSTIGIAVVVALLAYVFVEFTFIRPGRHMGGLFGRAETWVSRVDDMIDEMGKPAAEFKLTDDNYQRSIAKVAVARGGKSPLGVLPGNSRERDYLPLAYAGYIFAIFLGKTGFIGALFLCLLYLMVLFRACYASSRFADYTATLMIMGLALMITCQALISMMVAVGIGPVTGQPLPLISRGGTSVLITSVYFGVMMAVSREQSELQARQFATIEESESAVPEITLEE